MAQGWGPCKCLHLCAFCWLLSRAELVTEVLSFVLMSIFFPQLGCFSICVVTVKLSLRQPELGVSGAHCTKQYQPSSTWLFASSSYNAAAIMPSATWFVQQQKYRTVRRCESTDISASTKRKKKKKNFHPQALFSTAAVTSIKGMGVVCKTLAFPANYCYQLYVVRCVLI